VPGTLLRIGHIPSHLIVTKIYEINTCHFYCASNEKIEPWEDEVTNKGHTTVKDPGFGSRALAVLLLVMFLMDDALLQVQISTFKSYIQRA
jgi:hypothetical protein